MKTIRHTARTWLLICMLAACFCELSAREQADLYRTFRQPLREHRPMVRWWWNGDKLDEQEVQRELDLLKEIGIGGVEINPIRFPDDTDSVGYRTLTWLSPEWTRMVELTARSCRERDMDCDIIVGSGWPYGGEFLPRDEQLQLLTLETFDLTGGERFSITREEILRRVDPQFHSACPDPRKDLLFVRLLPAKITEFTPGIVLDSLAAERQIVIDVPEGDHVLYCFVRLTGYMSVILGAPGAKGPVLNHFSKAAVARFLDRMSDSLNRRMGKMGRGLRAAFTDSFELEGANWDDHMLREFRRRRGYDLDPYLPYIIVKVGEMGNPVKERYGSDIADRLKKELIARVRSDFELTRRELFHEAFVEQYNRWCHKNGMRSRVQAYGRHLHPVESSMYMDIPECESWMMHGIGREMPENQYMHGRSYSMMNKAVASGSYLAGNGVVSCEEATNVGRVFNESLEELKIVGDMSNLSGVNRSIFHGFNYSPPEAPFPGWIRYGIYLNENNPWWPHARRWIDYKARISAVFRQSELQSDVALLQPFEDVWAEHGMQRDPFPTLTRPAYAHNLWEAVHQNGNGCDYLSEGIIARGRVSAGRLHFGKRAYKTIILMEVSRISPEAAERLAQFVRSGGLAVCIGCEPSQSHGLRDAAANDMRVARAIAAVKREFPERFVTVPPPGERPLREWYREVQQKNGIAPYVEFRDTDPFLSQSYYRHGGKHIFFLVNYSSRKAVETQATFPEPALRGLNAWVWCAETGERYRLPGLKDGSMQLRLGPAESKLIVFDDTPGGEYPAQMPPKTGRGTVVEGKWDLTFTHHVDKTVWRCTLDRLVDLNTLPLAEMKHFAGTIDYTTTVTVDNPQEVSVLDAGTTFDGITSLTVNGMKAGLRWYGERRFDVDGLLRRGENTITIRVVTTLGNYCKSLENNKIAQTWTAGQQYHPLGLGGPVALY